MAKRALKALVAMVVAMLSLLAQGAPAHAETATTPVGVITATQRPGPCNDFGAVVGVSVAGGFANTPYTVTGSAYSAPAAFTTNDFGAGSGQVQNVKPDAAGSWTGNATITFLAGDETGTVQVYITCTDLKGDKG